MNSNFPRVRRILFRLLRALSWIVLALAFAGIAGAPLGIWSSGVERLTHFRLYWLAGLVLHLVWWGGVRRQRVPAVLSAALLAAGLPGVVKYYHDPPTASVRVPVKALSVATWNVWSSNKNYQPGLDWLRQCSSDVILLTEVSVAWAKSLPAATDRWPYQIRETRKGTTGLWLLSRWPLDPPDPRGIAPDQVHPWIHTVAKTPHGAIRVLGMHPRTPRGGQRFDQRNALLDLAAGIAASSAEPVILLGDLNCSPFSPWFHRLLETGHLRDSALGFGLTPTWQSGVWLLPIDHVLISGPLLPTAHEVHAERFGSDHHPIKVELTVESLAE